MNEENQNNDNKDKNIEIKPIKEQKKYMGNFLLQ